jgi:type IV secretory pathway VirJ component
MKRTIYFFFGLLIPGLNIHAFPFETLPYGSFGSVSIYSPAKVPEAFVLFVSGDGGWNQGVVDMAKDIVNEGALVVGIDIRQYFKNITSVQANCHYPASDFEDISLTLQKKYKFRQYLKPILIGYSSGATLVYGILAQAPANTFKGAISLGFCPDIEIKKPLCNGSGLKSHILKEGQSFYLEPSLNLTSPFIVLEGMIDQVCSYEDTKQYVEKIPQGELISLPLVGHGFSVAKNWLPQLIHAYQKIIKEPGYVEKLTSRNELLQSQHLSPLNIDLPLTLIPTASKENLPLAFFISGDGGWTSFDQALCENLAENGMPVAGLDAQKYFWNEKQPKEAADEIAKAIEHYMQQWGLKSFVLIGYSFGACVAPFIANNFSASLKESLQGVYCFSPDETGDFEIHITDMLSLKSKEKYNVLNELKKISSCKPVCIFGNEENIEMRNHFSDTGIRIETIPGNHHYDNDHNRAASIVYKDFSPGK